MTRLGFVGGWGGGAGREEAGRDGMIEVLAIPLTRDEAAHEWGAKL